MFGLDHWLAGLGDSGSTALAAAVLLGLRHATDPDHLTAVSTLVLTNDRNGARQAGWLGLAWGLGHATTLVAFGLPAVFFRRYLPDPVLQGAEAAIGVVIILLAGRLLLRWRRGYFHTHLHSHGGVMHAHPHVHENAKAYHAQSRHGHSHADDLGRSSLAAYGIGLVHGIGGSAAMGILMVGTGSSQLDGAAALMLFALGTAIAMAAVSSSFGYALARGAVARRVTAVVPLLALASLTFGVWYALNALGGLPLLLSQ